MNRSYPPPRPLKFHEQDRRYQILYKQEREKLRQAEPSRPRQRSNVGVNLFVGVIGMIVFMPFVILSVFIIAALGGVGVIYVLAIAGYMIGKWNST